MTDHFVGSFRQAPPKPGSLRINPSYGQPTLDALASKGHALTVSPTTLSAAATVISFDPTSHSLRAAGDPRSGRHAGAY